MYDFKMLSDFEFELLTQDLLQKELNIKLEGFKKGRDNGIDLRFSKEIANDIIVQCKHYANSTFSNLISNLKNKELSKINKLNPSRYILVTSQELSNTQKKKLFDILSPYVKSYSDIYGKEDLNNLIRKFPEIENIHYKLWFSSVNILEKIQHSAVYNISEIYIDRIQDKLKIYVQSKAYIEVLKKIEEDNICIVSGIPGIGKTTLAEMVLIYYLNFDYEIIKVSENIKEALEVFKSGKRQIFFYDDFLGQTGYNLKINKNEDNDLITFITYVKKSKNSKFILTTREYILNQARVDSEQLQRANFDINKFILKLDDYSVMDKAKILYNHLYFNKIKQAYIQNLMENDLFKIIKHENYNPRLIEIITGNFLPNNPNEFYKIFIKNLNNPSQIWKTAFTKHLSDESKNMVLLLATIDRYYTLNKLSMAEEQYNYYNSNKQKLFNKSYSNNDFTNSLKELENTFIKIEEEHINFLNPSVRDFIESYILENPEEFKFLCNYSLYFFQNVSLLNIAKKGEYKLLLKYNFDFADSLLDSLFSKDYILISFVDRIMLLMEMNLILKNEKIDEYITNDFLYNLSSNWGFYNISLEDCKSLLSAALHPINYKYFDENSVNEIYDFAYEVLLDEYIYDLEIFNIFEKIKSRYPKLTIEPKTFFEKFTNNLHVSDMDWSGKDEIDNYYEEIDKLGGKYNISVTEHLEDLRELSDDYLDDDYINEDKNNFKSNDINNDLNKEEILEMFETLLE